MKMKNSPPPVLSRILGCLIDGRVRYDALGEYEEMYVSKALGSGDLSALAWYLWQIFLLLFKYSMNTTRGSLAMLRNYFVSIIRNMKRQKIYTLLNVFGLALGLACFILISRYIQFELSYEKSHKNAERIHKVVTQVAGEEFLGSTRFAITPAPLAPALMDEFPEVEYATRLYKSSDILLEYKDRSYLEDDWLYADRNIFNIFTIPMLKGHSETAFNTPYTVVISERMAERYFGDENPIGKLLRFNSAYDFVVTGVMENMPANTHIRSDFIANIEALNELLFKIDNWGRRAFHTYLLLHEGGDADDLSRKYPAFLESKLRGRNWWDEQEADRYYHQRLLDIHLKADTIGNIGSVGDIKYIFIISMIAVFILIIACVNYMNLATARSARRAKEIGVRQLVGAKRPQLIRQFIGESVLLSFFSLGAAYILANFFLPLFNNLVDARLSLNLVHDTQFAVYLILIGLSVGIISGSYPALYLSGIKAVTVMKGSFSKNWHGALFRNLLVVGQFSISIFLLIGTFIISQQMHYIRNKKLGFSKDHIITAKIIGDGIPSHRAAFKKKLLDQAGILQVTFSSFLPMRFQNQIYMRYEGMPDQKNNGLLTYFSTVDHDYFKTFDMEIVQGRDFSKEIDHDSVAYIINETAVKKLGWKNPIGKMFGYQGSMGPVVGVVNDFHYADFHVALESVSFQLLPDDGRVLSIKFNGDDTQRVISGIEKTWKSFSGGYPFKYEFMDEKYDAMYRSEIRLKKVFRYFSMLTVLICCLGLFGLASYRVEQSSKEIGIRKVLGATDSGIFRLLSWKFTRGVVLANFLAWPAAYYFMGRWLEGFAYRIEMPWRPFLAAGILSFTIALTTVMFQSIRASFSNPVKALKYE